MNKNSSSSYKTAVQDGEVTPLLVEGNHLVVTSKKIGILMSFFFLVGGVGQLVLLPLFLDKFQEKDSTVHFPLVATSLSSFLFALLVGGYFWIFKRYQWNFISPKRYWSYIVPIGICSGISRVMMVYVSSPDRTSPVLQVLLSGIYPVFGLLYVKILSRKPGLECFVTITTIGMLFILFGCGFGVYEGLYLASNDGLSFLEKSLWEILYLLSFIFFSLSDVLTWFLWDKFQRTEGEVDTSKHFLIMINSFIWVKLTEILTLAAFFWVDILPTFGSAMTAAAFFENFGLSVETFFSGEDLALTLYGLGYFLSVIFFSFSTVGLLHPQYLIFRSIAEILILLVTATLWLTVPQFTIYPFPPLWQYLLGLALITVGHLLISYWRMDTFNKLFFDDESLMIDEESKVSCTFENPANTSSLFSQYTFSWITPLVLLGYKRPLEASDIWRHSYKDQAETSGRLFEKEWEIECSKPNPSIGWTFFRVFGHEFILPTTLFTIHLVASIVAPGILMRDLLSFLESGKSDPTVGWILAFAVFISQIITSSTIQNSFHTSVELGTRIKQTMMYVVYKKALKLSFISSTGEIINLSSNDSNKLFLICRNSQLGWSAIALILVVGGLLIVELGWAGLVGFVSLLLLVPFQFLISRQIAIIRRSTIKITDERIKTMNDVLSAVQLIKFFSWEDSFAKKIKQIRENEVKWLRTGKILKAINDSTSLCGSVVTTLITLVTYVLLGNELLASKVFTAITLLNMMRICLQRVPMFSKTFAEMFITFERLKKFLLQMDMVDNRILKDTKSDGKATITIKDATFIVGNDKASNHITTTPAAAATVVAPETEVLNPLLKDIFTLSNINLQFESGMLIGVVGSVGSGKSSLLNAVLGQMKILSGQVEIVGSLALASQEPWLINASLKDNILFGSPLRQKRYNTVLSNCELLDDLKQLPAGDMTEIGERGINLSGGQKQRVSLARAVYADRDIYLLDDPLSAVDRHVGNNLFHKCISGMLRGKLVLFVTNQLHFLDKCDKIVFLQDGKITAFGTFSELVRENKTFKKLLKKFTTLDAATTAEKKEDVKQDKAKEVDTKGRQEKGTIMTQENRSVGNVDIKNYYQYAQSAGIPSVVALLVLSILTGVTQVMNNWFISFWIDNSKNYSRDFFFGVYAALTILFVAVTFIRGFCFAFACLKSSTKIHNSVFKVIMHAPMTYFYGTPVGRILNRFSSDQDKVDEELPDLMYPAIHFSINSICTMGVIIGVLPYSALPAFFLFLIFIWIIRYFMACSRELRRLESVSVSPIFAHLSATLKGLPVIRAYKSERSFTNDYIRLLETHHSTLFIAETVGRWVGLRLDGIATLVVAATAIFVMVLRDQLSPSLAGLVLSYSFQMTGALQFAVRSFAETDSRMTSVERLLNCLHDTPQEAPAIIQNQRPPPLWPQQGQITFQNVYMKYPVSEAPVLKDLSFVIRAREKIGIVGRTGAGKSSITLSLFRIIEIMQGKIEIDGVDISQIGLSDLRKNLSIIPQDPVLFLGTIRSNLDPWIQYSDDQIYDALSKVRMDQTIKDLPAGLQTQITEGGSNFSLGQRQLLCISRSLLQNSKILVMDEATASIDIQTDNLIQRTIRESFRNNTVLTIAHRLNTIIDSDRIMVMDKGTLVEFDTPYNLLKKSDSYFLALVNESDDAEKLKAVAEELHQF